MLRCISPRALCPIAKASYTATPRISAEPDYWRHGYKKGNCRYFCNLTQFEYEQLYASKFENLCEIDNFLVEKIIYPVSLRRNEKLEQI